MIKLIIFDLDGVLVDARELHYESLNLALWDVGRQYVISRDEHLLSYDGLPTSTKLDRLTKEKGLPESEHVRVWKLKQEMTIALIDKFTRDEQKIDLLKKLKAAGYTIAVASNSVRDTVKMFLLRTGMIEHIDFYYSNQDVRHPKPHSEIHLRCMLRAGVNPIETVIVEDSNVGLIAATASGCHVCAVRDPSDVTHDRLLQEIANANTSNILRDVRRR